MDLILRNFSSFFAAALSAKHRTLSPGLSWIFNSHFFDFGTSKAFQPTGSKMETFLGPFLNPSTPAETFKVNLCTEVGVNEQRVIGFMQLPVTELSSENPACVSLVFLGDFDI